MTWALVRGENPKTTRDSERDGILAQFISPAGGSLPRVTVWLSTRLSGGSCFRKIVTLSRVSFFHEALHRFLQKILTKMTFVCDALKMN